MSVSMKPKDCLRNVCWKNDQRRDSVLHKCFCILYKILYHRFFDFKGLTDENKMDKIFVLQQCIFSHNIT